MGYGCHDCGVPNGCECENPLKLRKIHDRIKSDDNAHLFLGARVRYMGISLGENLHRDATGVITKFDYDRHPLSVRVRLVNGSEYWCKGVELANMEAPFPTSNTPPKADAINPSHYRNTRFEVIDIIEAFGLGFNLGNVVKYILRAGKKDPAKHVEDLKKARWYLDREIANLEKK